MYLVHRIMDGVKTVIDSYVNEVDAVEYANDMFEDDCTIGITRPHYTVTGRCSGRMVFEVRND